jgi:hypothetical protein
MLAQLACDIHRQNSKSALELPVATLSPLYLRSPMQQIREFRDTEMFQNRSPAQEADGVSLRIILFHTRKSTLANVPEGPVISAIENDKSPTPQPEVAQSDRKTLSPSRTRLNAH